MKKLTAFLTALILFLGTVVGAHAYCQGRLVRDRHAYATWTNEKKFSSWQSLTANLDEKMIPVFGSSEIQHGVDTEYHPAGMFRNTEYQPLLIGAGYYQSLGHAITLAAIGNQVKSKKAVLFLAPQWFRKGGVKAGAFASRFSEEQFYQMLHNDKLSEKTKTYLVSRAKKLLKADPKTKERVEQQIRELKSGTASWWEKADNQFYRAFLKEKDICQTVFAMDLDRVASPGTGGDSQEQAEAGAETDWASYAKKAEAEGEAAKQNPYYMIPAAYEKKVKLIKQGKVNIKKVTSGYKAKEETEDLQVFLDVCGDLDIEPMVVILPVNGYWFDYTGFGKEARAGYYDRIRSLLDGQQVKYTDLSKEEYTKYFFEDGIHPAGKGWNIINENLYRFFKQD